MITVTGITQGRAGARLRFVTSNGTRKSRLDSCPDIPPEHSMTRPAYNFYVNDGSPGGKAYPTASG